MLTNAFREVELGEVRYWSPTMYELKDDDFLTVKQVGKLLMIHPQTVRNYENEGRIPKAQRIGEGKYAKRRWYVSDIMPTIKAIRRRAVSAIDPDGIPTVFRESQQDVGETSIRPDEIRSILSEIVADGLVDNVELDDDALTSMEKPDEPKKYPFGPVKKGSCARK